LNGLSSSSSSHRRAGSFSPWSCRLLSGCWPTRTFDALCLASDAPTRLAFLGRQVYIHVKPPGGEMHRRQLRAPRPGNRSITSQVLLAYDDLGYSSNTASVYRDDPFLSNALLLSDSVPPPRGSART